MTINSLSLNLPKREYILFLEVTSWSTRLLHSEAEIVKKQAYNVGTIYLSLIPKILQYSAFILLLWKDIESAKLNKKDIMLAQLNT